MNRQQLAHVLRAACRVTGDPDVVVLGSQAVLGTFDETTLPSAATASLEVDLAFLDDDGRSKADRVEAAIGELSAFHATFGIYAEGLHTATAVLPRGWRNRLITWSLESSHPARPRFLEPHDLAVAKLVAAREKDFAFVDALLRYELIRVQVVRERVRELDPCHAASAARILRWLEHYDTSNDA